MTFYCLFCRQIKWLVISSQVNFNLKYRKELNALEGDIQDILILERCKDTRHDSPLFRCKNTEIYKYPDVLKVQL